VPLVKPHRKESKKNFISRCYGDEESVKTFPDQNQRGGYCYNAWKEKSKKAKYIISIADDEYAFFDKE